MSKQQPNSQDGAFNEEQQKVIRSMRSSRIILPIAISLAVVAYILYRQFDPKEFAAIEWSNHTTFWIILAISFIALRHFAYMARLYILTEGFFSWKKCFELIFIWEFSSAITPTSIGGAAVAFLMLSQEKLSMARTAAIVTYTIVLDAAFFIISVPIIYMIFGGMMFGPSNTDIPFKDWSILIFIVYLVIVTYGSLFAYGLFRSPIGLKKFFLWVCKLPFMKRFREKAESLGNEIIIASEEIGKKNWKYHIGAFITTATAWLSRFLILNFLFYAFPLIVESTFQSSVALFARVETFFLLMLYSPSPGGSGFTEYFFTPFFQDYISVTIAGPLVLLWRLLTYNSYLIIGAIITPNWIRKKVEERRKEKNA